MKKTDKKMLAVDLGASSGRVMAGSFDGEKISVEELHRFSNDPVTLRGNDVLGFPASVPRDQTGTSEIKKIREGGQHQRGHLGGGLRPAGCAGISSGKSGALQGRKGERHAGEELCSAGCGSFLPDHRHAVYGNQYGISASVSGPEQKRVSGPCGLHAFDAGSFSLFPLWGKML